MNNKATITRKLWQGLECVEFYAGGYKALLLPSRGGNLIKLTQGDINILRTPKTLEEYNQQPQTFGIPILFPPNRIDGGTFEFNNKIYQFPVNEIDKNNSLHGFLQDNVWEVIEEEIINDDCVKVTIQFKSNENRDFFEYYPHDFTCTINYILSNKGLNQIVSIVNNGYEKMPMAIGYHTAFDLNFANQDKRDTVLLRCSLGERVELTERLLPTGKLLALNEHESKFRQQGENTYYESMDNHYTVKEIDKDGKLFHGLELVDTETKKKVVYEVGKEYKHWMIWNGNMNHDFVCVEPQTWRINAPNLNISCEESGFITLESKQEWKEIATICVE